MDRLCLIPSGRTSRGFCAHSGGENDAGHGCQRGDREPFPCLCALCPGSLAEGHSPRPWLARHFFGDAFLKPSN